MRLRNLKSQTNEGMFDSLKSFASKAVDKATDASGEGEKQSYIKDFQQKYNRWVTQTQPSGTNPADIDIIIKYLKTQLKQQECMVMLHLKAHLVSEGNLYLGLAQMITEYPLKHMRMYGLGL